MGSQYLSLHLVDPAPVQARLRGDFPDIASTIYSTEKPPSEELRPAFELMGRGTFVFLPKRAVHPEGILFCRAETADEVRAWFSRDPVIVARARTFEVREAQPMSVGAPVP